MAKTFEVLDVIRFASPNVRQIDPFHTSTLIRERLSGKGFMDYRPLWSRMPSITARFVSDAEISMWWQKAALINAMHAINGSYRQAGSWYGFSRVQRNIFGVQMKPSVRGVLFRNDRAEAHLINPRKGQILSENDFRFLARACYEEHCRNDPNDPIPFVVDTSEVKKGKGRIVRDRECTNSDMISVDEFESIMDLFFQSIQLAGYPIDYRSGDFSSDMFGWK